VSRSSLVSSHKTSLEILDKDKHPGYLDHLYVLDVKSFITMAVQFRHILMLVLKFIITSVFTSFISFTSSIK
jgi:hypothetical protein